MIAKKVKENEMNYLCLFDTKVNYILLENN